MSIGNLDMFNSQNKLHISTILALQTRSKGKLRPEENQAIDYFVKNARQASFIRTLMFYLKPILSVFIRCLLGCN